jgi:hypothetical protein
VDGITRGSLASPETRRQSPRMRRCIVVQKIPGPTFLKLRPNAMNKSDQHLSHLFIKFTVFNLFFGHKFVKNYTFSIKKCSRQCFQPRFLSCNNSRPSLNLLRNSNTLVLDKHFHRTPFSTFQTFQCLFSTILHKTQSLFFVPFRNLRYDEKSYFTKTNIILICINQTS